VSFVEADGPDFESFRIAVLFGLSGITFVVTGKEAFSWLEGPRIISIRGSALPSPTYLRPPKRGLRVGGSGFAQAGLNLSPLARLLRHDQLVLLISFPVFITGREMLTLFLSRVDNPLLQVKIGLA
jgi:hypothetical protein